MSTPKDLNITLNSEGNNEAVLRIGEAPRIPDVREKQKIYLTTSLAGPAEFFEKIAKKNQSELSPITDTAIVSVAEDNLSLSLSVDPTDDLAAVIIGKLVPNPEIKNFKINKKDGKFTAKQLAEMLRENFHNLVTDKALFREFTQKIMNLNYKVTKEVEASDDERGNVVEGFVQKLDVEDMPKSIKFKAPLYLGEPSIEFEVEIGIEAGQNGLLFYLFSTDLGLLQREIAEKIIKEQVDFFKKEDICIVYSV